MSIKELLLKRTIVNKITRSLTGNMKDLKKLSGLSKIAEKDLASPGLSAFLVTLDRDIEQEAGMAKLFVRLGKATGKIPRRKLVENFIYNWNVKGANLRKTLRNEEEWIPNFFTISPTMRCNLRCTGCYSGLYEKDGSLTEEEIDKIFAEARSLGIYFIVISGGEPYIMKDAWLRLFKKYNDMYFLTYTNGTLIDEKLAKDLGRLGNVIPAISVEGYAHETDDRRGKGIHQKVLDAMDRLRSEGVIYGISVTATRHNIDVITEEKFVEYYMDKGAIFGWYFMFMPVGKDPILDMVPTPEQRVYTGQKVAELRKKYPIFLADFWNDGPAAAGCLSGGRQYMHILNSGRVEACVFAHFGVDNIRDKSIKEVANSPFFKEIRRSFPYNEEGNLKRPCMIIDNPQVLRNAVDKFCDKEGHDHSEDIVHDPEVVKWVDNYAEEFRKLTDPEWEKTISDPKDRWYKEGNEYKNLFQFKNTTVKAAADEEPEKEETLV
jgi:MoaA/NifB/PqqE/SkfB family radical SAM enzyme